MNNPKNKGRRIKRTLIGIAILFALSSFWLLNTFRYKGVVEQISFSSDEVTMKGLYIKPDAPGPYPSVVLLHGSGPLPADGPPVRVIANALLKHGVAVLCYDKRGVGASGGTFRHNAYDDFVEDGINAVHYLNSRNDVDHKAIGLLGSSEGSIIAPEIALRSKSVAFVIHRAGIAVDAIECNLWEQRHEQIDRGISGDLLEDSIRLQQLIFEMLVESKKDPKTVESESWHQVDAEIVSFNQKYRSNETWIKHGKRFGNKLADWERFFEGVASAIAYDPQPFIEQLDIPMLYIFAEKDENVPTSASVKYLKSLKMNSSKQLDIRIIPDVDHSMITPISFVRTGSFVPQFLDAMGPWIHKRFPSP
ncbi:MAG: alpha/beta fold hydrolase [Verrucomicrobia bacterium]|nr:alpha/beta fold hydrolase [Verrucomicrobiota bacterium]